VEMVLIKVVMAEALEVVVADIPKAEEVAL
jgi:hypothetical protein